MEGWKKKAALVAGVLALALVFCFGLNESRKIEAADGTIGFMSGSGSTEGDLGNEPYILNSQRVRAYYSEWADLIAKYPNSDIKWISMNETVILITESEAKNPSPVLSVQGAGTATIALMVDGAPIAKRDVVVESLFKQLPDLFTKIDNKPVVYLKWGTDYKGKKLELLNEATGVVWACGETDVIKVDKDTGEITLVGTGVATIVATYMLEAEQKTATVPVYVGPNVILPSSSITTGSAIVGPDTIKLHKDDKLYPGIVASSQLQITDKVEWEIEDSEHNVISKSSDSSLKVLTYGNGGYDDFWSVIGKAGTYYLNVATKGCMNLDKDVALRTGLKHTYTLKIYAEARDYHVSLQSGDSFDVAEFFNIEPEDFKTYFDHKTINTTVNEENVGYYKNYDTGLIVAGEYEIPSVIAEFSIRDPKLGDEILDRADVKENAFRITITIYKGFSLSQTSIRMPLNSELALRVVPADSVNKGDIKWSTSDSKYVTVDQEGNVKAVGVTPDNEPAIVTATLTMTNGKIMNATCLIRVDSTATGINLNKKETDIEVEQSETIRAQLEPGSVKSAKLRWLVSDESILDISVQEDTLSAVITGKKAGSVVVTVLNEDNYVAGYCMVTVRSPIQDLKNFPDRVVVYQHYGVYKFNIDIEPADATSTKLKWMSDDENIARFDDPNEGIVTIGRGGTTSIWVVPEWNPNKVRKECIFTVIESAKSFGIKENSVTVAVGNTVALTPEITSETASTEIKWDSMNKSVATVTDKGVVKGVAGGETYIIATSTEGFVDTCKVTVTQGATGVTLDTYSVTLAVGESQTVVATPNPAGATEKKYTWTSRDEAIASVDNDGKITGVAPGYTTVMVKTTGGGVEYVYVTVYSKATSMKLNYDKLTVIKGDKAKLKAVFTPSDVTNKNVKWTSTDDKIATVSEKGVVKGVKGGTVIISATSEDGGYVATCLVTVKERSTSVKLNHSSYILGVGKKVTLKATVKSNSASNPKVKWTTSNSKIATVSQSGKVTGKKVGTVTIRARVTDGTNKSATCKVRVVKQATGISLNKRVLTVVVGHTSKLKATIKPSSASVKSVKWDSTDKEVAEVTGGVIVGLKEGSTKVTATTKDNSNKTATCYVTVIEEVPATSIVLSAQNLTLVKGQSQKIGYSIVPHNHTDEVFFDSDNRAVATVSGTGKVYARRSGVANITITTTSGKQATVQVRVIGLNKTRLTMEQYDTEVLVVDGVTSGVTWFSSAPSIATVTNQGVVVARKPGSCYIYAKYNGINLSCRVVVNKIK